MIENLTLEEIQRFADRYTLGYERGEGSYHFLRVSIPNGIVTTDQFRGIAELAERYGRGYAEVTTRQDIQIHWIRGEDALDIFSRLEELGLTTDKCGQGYPAARYGDVRNIVGCPVTGIDKHEVLDISPFIRKAKAFFTGNKEFLDLPRKFKISITGCAINCTNPEIQDLGLMATKVDGRVGFVAFIGGKTGVPATFGKPLGVFIEPEKVIKVIIALVEIFRDYGRRDSKAKARFKWLVEEWGVEKLRNVLEDKLGERLERYEHGCPSVSGEEHVGINQQKQEGLWYINFPLLGGKLTAEQMFKLADIAERYGWPEIRLTSFQNLILVGIKDVRKVIDEVRNIGINFTDSPVRWTTLACPSNFCGKAPENAKRRAEEIVHYIERRFSGVKNFKVRIFISGCPNACARHPIADIGLQAVKLRNGVAGYNIFLGGGLGSNPSFARLVKKGVEGEKVKLIIERLITAYLGRRLNGETFKEFCNRHTDEQLRGFMEGV